MADRGPKIETVLFDADGVVQFAGPIYPHFAERYGWPQEKLDAFVQALFHEWLDVDAALTSEVDLLAVLGPALVEWGWAGSAAEFTRDWFRLGAVPDPTALDLIAALRHAGTRCMLASNQDMMRARFMDEELGYRGLFDGRFYSYALGYAKPDAGYFQSVLAALGAQPGQVLFIDDREENVETARGCGLRAELHLPGSSLRDRLAGYSLPV